MVISLVGENFQLLEECNMSILFLPQHASPCVAMFLVSQLCLSLEDLGTIYCIVFHLPFFVASYVLTFVSPSILKMHLG